MTKAPQNVMVTIRRINAALEELYSDEADRQTWWNSPQKLLGMRAPINCPIHEVERLIDQLESGAYI